MTCERCGRCAEGDFANCKNARSLAEASKGALPFVAYAYSKGIDGAEDAGRAIESALVGVRTTLCSVELEPAGWQYRVTAGPQTGWSLWGDGRGEEFEKHYTVERRQIYAIKASEARNDA